MKHPVSYGPCINCGNNWIEMLELQEALLRLPAPMRSELTTVYEAAAVGLRTLMRPDDPLLDTLTARYQSIADALHDSVTDYHRIETRAARMSLWRAMTTWIRTKRDASAQKTPKQRTDEDSAGNPPVKKP